MLSLANGSSTDSFYYCDEIVNVFIEKMERTIGDKVEKHQRNLGRAVLGSALCLAGALSETPSALEPSKMAILGSPNGRLGSILVEKWDFQKMSGKARKGYFDVFGMGFRAEFARGDPRTCQHGP